MRRTHILLAILQPATAAKPPLFGPHGFDLAGMDTTVNACDNFYQFAVGKWRDTHPLPAQYSRFGRFEEVADRNRDVLHAILEEDAASAATAPPHQSLAICRMRCSSSSLFFRRARYRAVLRASSTTRHDRRSL
jgi:hypothetical protein